MRYALAVLSLASLTACSASKDVWLIKIADGEAAVTIQTCDENLDSAECPTVDDPEPSEWTSETMRERSPQVGFVEFLDGPNGERYLVHSGRVYPGTKIGKEWVFTWDQFGDSTDEQKHESGYLLRQSGATHTEVTYRLNFKGKTAAGTFEISTSETDLIEESDSWLFAEVGFEEGQLARNIDVNLAGEVINLNDQRDCSGGDLCWVTWTTTTTRSLPITLFRTDAGQDDFNGVVNATQPAG